jgi:hypothetical protein
MAELDSELWVRWQIQILCFVPHERIRLRALGLAPRGRIGYLSLVLMAEPYSMPLAPRLDPILCSVPHTRIRCRALGSMAESDSVLCSPWQNRIFSALGPMAESDIPCCGPYSGIRLSALGPIAESYSVLRALHQNQIPCCGNHSTVDSDSVAMVSNQTSIHIF